MWRGVRLAVMWLVALALPLQGLAAATMLSCGPGHHRMAAAQPVSAPAHDRGAHDHASASHAHDADQHEAATDPKDRDGTAAGEMHQLAKFKCSACAACCSATALPSSVITFDPQQHAADFDALPFAPSVQFQTGGPERPPRSSLV
jgi:hypothetical protein